MWVDAAVMNCSLSLFLCLYASDASSFSLRALLPSNVTYYYNTVKLVIAADFGLIMENVYSLH